MITLPNGESKIYCTSASSSQQNEVDDAVFYNTSIQLQYHYLGVPGCIKIEIITNDMNNNKKMEIIITNNKHF